MSLNLNEWYAVHSRIFLLAVLGVAVYGFRAALGGRPLFKADPFET